MKTKKPEVNRFFRKGQYKTYDKSLFHKWLKEVISEETQVDANFIMNLIYEK